MVTDCVGGRGEAGTAGRHISVAGTRLGRTDPKGKQASIPNVKPQAYRPARER